jgi:hypothetical protein
MDAKKEKKSALGLDSSRLMVAVEVVVVTMVADFFPRIGMTNWSGQSDRLDLLANV